MNETPEDAEDQLEGAVIEGFEYGIDGFHLFLKDGRTVLFPDAQIVAVMRKPRTLQ